MKTNTAVRFIDYVAYKEGFDNNEVYEYFSEIKEYLAEKIPPASNLRNDDFELIQDGEFDDTETMKKKYKVALKSSVDENFQKALAEVGPFSVYVME